MVLRLTRSKVFWFLVGLAGVFLLCYVLPCNFLFDHANLVRYLHMAGLIGVCIFVIAHTVATGVGLPGTILTVAGGAVYGLFWGTVWSVLGAGLGAIAAFWLARHLLRDWVEHHFGHHPTLNRLKHIMHHNALTCVLTIRFTPISPFNVVNFLFGLTPIGLKPYAVGTFVGIIPGTMAYTWLGAAGMDAMDGRGLGSLGLALGFLIFLTLLPIAIKPLRRRQAMMK